MGPQTGGSRPRPAENATHCIGCRGNDRTSCTLAGAQRLAAERLQNAHVLAAGRGFGLRPRNELRKRYRKRNSTSRTRSSFTMKFTIPFVLVEEICNGTVYRDRQCLCLAQSHATAERRHHRHDLQRAQPRRAGNRGVLGERGRGPAVGAPRYAGDAATRPVAHQPGCRPCG